MKLQSYMQDGANHQARAVLCFLQGKGDIEDSWDEKYHTYQAQPEVARWENCREQGYVVSMRSRDFKRQLNIAWFEHRNSDSICAVEWEQNTLNSPIIDTAQFGDVYKTKFDVSHSTRYRQAAEMADWIWSRLETFWMATKQPAKDGGHHED